MFVKRLSSLMVLSTALLMPMRVSAEGFLGCFPSGVVHVDLDGLRTRLTSDIPTMLATAQRGFIGVYESGTYFIGIEGERKLLTGKKPSALVSAPNGFIGVFGDGTYFVGLDRGVKRLASQAASVLASAPNGFIGTLEATANFFAGTYSVDLDGNHRLLTERMPTQLLAAPEGAIGVFESGVYYLRFDGAHKKLSSILPSQIASARNGFVGVYGRRGTIFTDFDGNQTRISESRPSLITSAAGGFIGVIDDGVDYFEFAGHRTELTKVLPDALVPMLSTHETVGAFSTSEFEDGLLAGAEAVRIAALSIEQLADRDPSRFDERYFDWAISDLEAQGSAIVRAKAAEIAKQIRFAKRLLAVRDSFARKVAWEPLAVYHYNSNGSRGAFHAELSVENAVWQDHVEVERQRLPLRDRLNYVHNALLKAYLKARHTGRLETFFTEAFEIARYCIDARTEVLIAFLDREDHRDDPFYGCATLEEAIQKIIQIHSTTSQNAGKSMTTESLREALRAQVGARFKGVQLGEEIVEGGVRAANELGLLE